MVTKFLRILRLISTFQKHFMNGATPLAQDGFMLLLLLFLFAISIAIILLNN